ncbi:MAG: hypothetical protein GY906_39240 [bacterium]|nr:hypothetical protein [bacterium]
MASLAGLLLEEGHDVRGVDSQLYPPMSDLLESLGVPVRLGFDPTQIPTNLDRVIIGNAVPRTNPEVEAILERGIPHLSQAEAVACYLLGQGLDSVVVAGTHGKTTTSSLLAWIMESTGQDPTYLIGGLLSWNKRSFRRGAGSWCVLEGDEYNAAFFDRGPKFLHYRPRVFVLGPVEYDHADLYPNFDAVMTAFRAGVAQVPKHGAIVVNAWSDEALAACSNATTKVIRVGNGPSCDLTMLEWSCTPEESRALLRYGKEKIDLAIPLAGLHNLQNACLALATADVCGVDPQSAVQALAKFPGVARRLEILGEEGGVLVVDDFAHHPTALRATLTAAKDRWPERRLVAAFEPRSLTAAKRDCQADYIDALALSQLALVAAPYHRDRLSEDQVLDRREMATQLAKVGTQSLMPEPGENSVDALLHFLRPGDVVVGCSSGSFDGFHRELLARLSEERFGRKEQ